MINMTPVKFQVKSDNVVKYGAFAITSDAPIKPDEVERIFEKLQSEQPEGVHLKFDKILPKISKTKEECENEEITLADSDAKIKEIVKNTVELLQELDSSNP
jgi:hypothetical protein